MCIPSADADPQVLLRQVERCTLLCMMALRALSEASTCELLLNSMTGWIFAQYYAWSPLFLKICEVLQSMPLWVTPLVHVAPDHFSEYVFNLHCHSENKPPVIWRPIIFPNKFAKKTHSKQASPCVALDQFPRNSFKIL